MIFLSMAWLHKNVGLQGVARAIGIYMKAVEGKLDPKVAFKCTEFLKSEPME